MKGYGSIVSASGEASAVSGALRVLIVDDNAPGAQTTGWMVEMMDFDYRLTHTPQDGIEAAMDYRPHIVLLDIGLPGMNGFELCARLRAVPELAGTVFIAQTGWAQEEYRHRAAEAGFHHFLAKPVAFETLEALLKGVADRIRS